jgi:hypothetical protein
MSESNPVRQFVALYAPIAHRFVRRIPQVCGVDHYSSCGLKILKADAWRLFQILKQLFFEEDHLAPHLSMWKPATVNILVNRGFAFAKNLGCPPDIANCSYWAFH